MTAIFYSLIFFMPAMLALDSSIREIRPNKLLFVSFFTFLSLIIGLRFEVGPDWFLYLSNMHVYKDYNSTGLLFVSDPGYALLNSIALDLGFSIWFPNLICGMAFCYGLYVICKTTPNPWLALTIATPYLVMVMSMNYTRQAAAFGFFVWALTYAFDNRPRSLLLMSIATLFHKSAIIGFLLIFFCQGNLNLRHIFILGLLIYGLFSLLVATSFDAIYMNYIVGQMESDGAGVRLALNCLPALIFLIFRNRFRFSEKQKALWSVISIAVLSLIPLLILTPYSTIIDRFNLYFFIIQIVLTTHIPGLVKGRLQRLLTTFLLVCLYGISFFVWMSYANFSWAWFPYKFYPLEAL